MHECVILGLTFVGVDYIGNSMALTLNPEDASMTVPVSIISDMILESDEQFLGSLSIPVDPPSGLGPSATASTATITISDDESRSYYYSDIQSHACTHSHMHTHSYAHTHMTLYTHSHNNTCAVVT